MMEAKTSDVDDASCGSVGSGRDGLGFLFIYIYFR